VEGNAKYFRRNFAVFVQRTDFEVGLIRDASPLPAEIAEV